MCIAKQIFCCLYIYVLLFTRKSKKKQKRRLLYDLLFTWKSEKRLPECLGKGTRGRVVFQKREPLSAWNGALGEGLFKNNEKCSSLSAWDKALGEEDLKKRWTAPTA
jgi:hypothetical protein